MKKWWFLLGLLLLIKPVLGSVVIQEVLYNPSVTESGGEAVLLYNQDNVSVDISGWTLATEASNTDATLPPDSVLLPKQSFLVGDKGWEEVKGDLPSADHEETILLGNTNAGVALMNGETIVDVVGWGDTELKEGTSHEGVEEGKSLRRINNTNDNAHDFIESEPLMSINSGLTLPIIIVVNESEQFTGELTLDIDKIEVLDAKPGETRIIPATITNNGNLAVDLAINHDISEVQITLSKTRLNPQESVQIQIEIDIPNTPGRYEGLLRIGSE
jgi:hypothetical protein